MYIVSISNIYFITFKFHVNSMIVMALLIIAAFLFAVSAVESPAPSPAPVSDGLGCDGKCAYRCSRSGWRDRCLKYCGI
ncbi:hypothetical protein SSX86_002928 [Deinandra increscens subsp. villosa]|uniref:Uncharacterized protein n=1 Tax=Deinandra increscens subsp. villosa TaxID=3103831 RepID=A0AAP0HDP8_9ASTR